MMRKYKKLRSEASLLKSLRTRAVNKLREAVYTRDGMMCYICNRTVRKYSCKEPDASTIDHVIPKSKGGQDTMDNLRTCCRKCNNEKADKMPVNQDNPNMS